MSLRPRRPRPRERTSVPRPRLRTRSLRTRLLVFISATLVLVCATMGLTTAFVQRAYLMGDLDGRVAAAASRSLGGASLHPQIEQDLGFLNEKGHATGMLAARLDEDGRIVAAEVVSRDPAPKRLTAAQTAALANITADGSKHTRTVPGLGTYRLTAVESGGVRVLAGLPMDDVQGMIGGLVVAEAAVAVAVLFVAGCVCTVVIRRQLRPSAGSPPPPPRSPAPRSTVARSPASPACRPGTPTPPARPDRSAPPSTA